MRNHLTILLLLFAVPLLAASPRDSMLVSADWLRAHLNDPNLVLLHVGDKAEYDAKHIPGAVYVGLKDISVSDHTGKGLMLEMPPAEEPKKDLEALGVSDASRVVVYYGKDWISPSTRILFTLDYAGLGGSLLDGGMPAWIEAGNDTTNAAPAAKKGSLSPLKVKPLVVDAEYVKSHLHTPGIAIVDGRDAIFYDGVESGGGHAGKHRTGHIAGAHSFPIHAARRRQEPRPLCPGPGRALRQGRREAGRHRRRLLPHRPAGHGDALRRALARPSRAAVRRLVRGLGFPVDNPAEKK